MVQEVNRLLLLSLYSENNIFDKIEFKEGINLILGEKFDETSIHGRKTNGVGKSLCIDFIRFCLLANYRNLRIKKIPEEILPLNENICLEFILGKDKILIKRNRKNESMPIILKNNEVIQFTTLDEAKKYMAGLLYNNMNGKSIPSFRSLLSLLMREEESNFSDILKCHKINNTDVTPHLYLFSIMIEFLKNYNVLYKDMEENTKVIKNLKQELTNNGQKKISDIASEINSLNDEVQKIEKAVESFKNNEAFDSLENEIIKLEQEISSLRDTKKILNYNLKKIQILPKPEKIDDSEIKLLYNEFKENLGDLIVKNLEEIVSFKNKIEEFQNMLINEKAEELKKEILIISKKLETLDNEYSEKIKILDKKGVLKDLKTSLSIFQNKKEELNSRNKLYELYVKTNNAKLKIKSDKSNIVVKLNDEIEKNKNIIISFNKTISNIHEQIMGNKNCSFDINIIDKSSVKNPINLSMRIDDDGSHSVNRTKVFIYDIGLLFNENTQKKHPLFLVHDNIFDVDQDTLVQCLNYLYSQQIEGNKFQYILTLNRDKIESEERKKKINFEIDLYRRAIFTKKNKFLKKDYQEK